MKTCKFNLMEARKAASRKSKKEVKRNEDR